MSENTLTAYAWKDGYSAGVKDATRPEIVICSAIRLPDGRIFRGHRHNDCIRTAFDAVTHNGGVDSGEHHWHPSMCSDQGFITSHNRYVDRQEGLRLQLAAGIKSVRPRPGNPHGYCGFTDDLLFSEDLY
jgi:hypothetical protein